MIDKLVSARQRRIPRRQFLVNSLKLGGLAAAPGLLTACGAGSEVATNGEGATAGNGGGELAFWQYKYPGGSEGAAYLEGAAKRFQEQTEVTVNIEFKSAEGIEQAVAAAANAGQGFDAMLWWSGPTARNQGELGNVITLDDVVGQDVWEHKLGLEAQEGPDGQRYGLTHTISAWFVFYNRQILEAAGLDPEQTFPSADQPPLGWDEFLEVCDRIKTDAGVAPLMWANKEGFFNEWWFYNLQSQAFDSAEEYKAINLGDESWQDERVYGAMEAWKQLYDRGYFFEGGEVVAYEQHPRQVVSGQAALSPYFSVDLAVAELRDAIGAENVGYTKMPAHVSGTALFDANCMEPNSLYVASFSDNQEAAVEWITFLASVEELNALAEATQESPGDTRWDADVITDPQVRAIYVGATENSTIYPYAFCTQAQYEALLSSGILFLTGQMSAQELAAEFDAVDEEYKASL